jgi:hypothetical protein
MFASVTQRLGIPFELVKESPDALLKDRVPGVAILVKRVLHMRNGKDRGNARHAELTQGHPQLHCGAHAAESARRITNDGRRSKEILLEEMIQQVLQRWRNAMIVFP